MDLQGKESVYPTRRTFKDIKEIVEKQMTEVKKMLWSVMKDVMPICKHNCIQNR